MSIANAQFDDFKLIELITFETESERFVQGSPTTNCWEIGEPSGDLFDEAYSVSNAVVTKLDSSYPSNNHSWFDIMVFADDDCFESLNVSFYQKMNTMNGQDGGYFTVSRDMGKTWCNIINDTIDTWRTPVDDIYACLYNATDTLFNGEPGFSGTNDEWELVMFEWFQILVIKEEIHADTMLIRFNFISNSVDKQMEGWMIDDIKIISVDYGGSVADNQSSYNLSLFPNPINDKATLQSKDGKIIVRIECFNLQGQVMVSEQVHDDSFIFNRGALSKGSYFIRCYFLDGSIESLKFIVN